MIKKFCVAILVLLCSCKQNKIEQKITTQKDSVSKRDTLKFNNPSNYRFYSNTNWLKNIPKDSITEMYWKEIIKRDSLNKEVEHALINSFPLKDKSIIFLQNGKNYKSLINQTFCKTISEPERAALGYLTILYRTLNGCYYKDEINEEYLMRNTLNLDNQYLERFKNYMKFWFRNDPKSLEQINNCQEEQMCHGSVVAYYSQISLTVKGNNIFINCKIKGFSRDIWACNWTENLVFLINKDKIKLIDRKESKQEYVYYYPNGSDVEPPDGYIYIYTGWNEKIGQREYSLPKKSKKK